MVQTILVRVTAGRRSNSDGSRKDWNEGPAFRGVGGLRGTKKEG